MATDAPHFVAVYKDTVYICMYGYIYIYRYTYQVNYILFLYQSPSVKENQVKDSSEICYEVRWGTKISPEVV